VKKRNQTSFGKSNLLFVKFKSHNRVKCTALETIRVAALKARVAALKATQETLKHNRIAGLWKSTPQVQQQGLHTFWIPGNKETWVAALKA